MTEQRYITIVETTLLRYHCVAEFYSIYQTTIMKKVEAIVRFSKFEDIKEALEAIGVNFFTYFEVNGHGKQKGEAVTYRGAVYDSGDIPRLKLEIVLPDEKVTELIETLVKHGQTGNIGDGKIIVSSVDDFVRIRTGEKGNDAL